MSAEDVRPIPLPFVSNVAGVAFRQDEVQKVRLRQPLVVEHDPGNPYDGSACAVRTLSGELLGYVPKQLSPRLVATGQGRWPAVVDEMLPGDTWGFRVKIGVAEEPEAPRSARRPALPGPVHAEAESDRGPLILVYAASGRLLGSLTEDGDTHVVVRTATGNTARYPKSAVEVARPEA